MNEEISADIRRMIYTSISDTVRRSYNELNVELNDLSGKFGETEEIRLIPPSIEDISHSRMSLELVSIREELKETVDQLNKMAESSCEEERIEISNEIRLREQEFQKVQNKLTELGVYKPEYKEITIEGGENNGKIVGRAFGELLDVVFLLWNPAGAAAEAGKGAKALATTVQTVDKVKDGTTIMRYAKGMIHNFKSRKKTAEKGKEAAEKTMETVAKGKKILQTIMIEKFNVK